MADKRPHLHVEFFTRPIENPKKSKEAGRPIFEDQEFIRIRFAGDRNRTLEAPATQKGLRDRATNEWLSYIDRFPQHYEAFKKGQSYVGPGTPLAELPFLTESKRAELRALNIHTAEDLADIDGTPLKQLGMGGRELKNQAAAWIDKAKGSVDMTKMAAANAALQDEMETLRSQVAELLAARQQPSQMPASTSRFAGMTADQIKTWIAEASGTRPKGNPSLATLIASADEIDAQQARALPPAQANAA